MRPVYVVCAAQDVRGVPGREVLLACSNLVIICFPSSFQTVGGAAAGSCVRYSLSLSEADLNASFALRWHLSSPLSSPSASRFSSSLFFLFFCYRYHASLDTILILPPHRSLAITRFALLLLLCSYKTSAKVPPLTRLVLAGLSSHVLRYIVYENTYIAVGR